MARMLNVITLLALTASALGGPTLPQPAALAADEAKEAANAAPPPPPPSAQKQKDAEERQAGIAEHDAAGALQSEEESRSDFSGENFQSFKDQCGLPGGLQITPDSVALLENPGFPGAGMDQSAITPFQTILKDGFMKVDCIKDMMYSQGDKHGPAKHSYNQAKISGVSIIRYDMYVKKLDRKPMTQKVCFDFCRTVPNMGFFGLVNGRHCYCTPFYKAQASDSSMCDASCEGSPNQMCGGKEKSMVFAMHFCDDSAALLAAAITKGNASAASLLTKCALVDSLAIDLESLVDYLEPQFGAVGDSVATTNLQTTRTTAGLMMRDSFKACVNGSQGSLATEVTAAQGAAPGVLIAEKFKRDIEAKVVIAVAAEANMDALIAQAQNAKDVNNSALDFYPLVYFIDKSLLADDANPHTNVTKVPTTCGGKAVGKPMIATDKDSCASACNAQITGCVGFQYIQGRPGRLRAGSQGHSPSQLDTANLCLLFGEFKSISYYTGCGAAGPYTFLQQRQAAEEDMLDAPYEATCYGKFSKFQGLSLKKISKKVNRCYKAPPFVNTTKFCGFENSSKPYCGIWTGRPGASGPGRAGDIFDWSHHTAGTGSFATGPSQAPEGTHYMYIETSWPRKKDDNATLETTTGVLRSGAYLEFQYSMYGAYIGTLSVIASPADAAPGAANTVLTMSGEQTKGHNEWKTAKADLSTSTLLGAAWKLQIAGVRGGSWQGDIAIDAVTLYEGR